MKAVKQQLLDILATAKGVRVDVILARVAVLFGVAGGLSTAAGFLPGKIGGTVSAICMIAGSLSPRIQHASGLLTPVYAGQVPFLKIVPELIRTLFNAPQIIADAKVQAQEAEETQAKAQADQTRAEIVKDTIAGVAEQLKSGSFLTGELSDSIPPELRAALVAFAAKPLPNLPSETGDDTAVPSLSTPILTSSVSVSDKASV